MPAMPCKVFQFSFKPSLIGSLVCLVCIPLFINFGLWQYNKAQKKIAIQAVYEQGKINGALPFPTTLQGDLTAADWQYKKVTVSGEYLPQYQFLLDNQVEDNRVGFHVITPLKISGTAQHVLVNRGWVAGSSTHSEVPSVATPSGVQTVVGQVWVPSKKIFSLEAKTPPSELGQNQPWKTVWQHMRLDEYQARVPFSVSTMAIKLDPASEAGGFVRNWTVSAERITTHMGYAYQWFGFAVATLLIFIYMSVSRIRPESAAD